MITVEDLTFSYRRQTPILHGLSFSIDQGEIFGFLGPNGSGKSTTQKILTGILEGYGGEVKVFGRTLPKQSKNFLQDIGVLFEYPYLYSNLSGYDNLKYFASFYDGQRAADITTLLDRLEFKPDYIHQPVARYSKGMRQRISMARALINRPRLLFLDEPTSGLDPQGAVLFRQIIAEEKAKGTTIFLTTHNMLDADLLCDRVAFLADGEIKVIDSPKTLKEASASGLVEITYLKDGLRKQISLDMVETFGAMPFAYDQIVSLHSQEPSLEDVFIQYTGRSLV